MIILVSAPSTGEPAESVYEMDEPYPSAMHQGLKRDIKYEPLKSGNRSMQDGLPLFEKYQFLSPGKSFHQHPVKPPLTRSIQVSSWVSPSACSSSSCCGLPSLLLQDSKSHTWLSARRWALLLRTRASSSRYTMLRRVRSVKHAWGNGSGGGLLTVELHNGASWGIGICCFCTFTMDTSPCRSIENFLRFPECHWTSSGKDTPSSSAAHNHRHGKLWQGLYREWTRAK